MMRSPNRIVGLVLGTLFLAFGGFGFLVTGGIGFFATQGGQFLGIFEFNPLQNIVHILVGAALAMSALANIRVAALTNAWTGAFLLVLGLAGLFLVGAPTNVFAINSADNVLHFGAAAVLLAVGLGAEQEATARPAAASARAPETP